MLGIVLTVLAIIGVGIALLDNNVPEEWTETEEASDTLEFVDLGLPSGTKWSNINQTNPNDSYDFYTYDEAVQQFGEYISAQVLANSLTLVDQVNDATELDFEDYKVNVNIKR